ncbi:MAG TPA: biotin-dependent carboxyltransferase family protein [Candidatus Udaeobacter sp.]|nr:biotin-dependent carboxyltransferase family protein [Candidatus Udaeobacter sp.]
MTELLRVVEPGLLSTIQDLGRPHAIASGVPPGGAMDRFAHTVANLLVGNDRSAATIECTLRGPRIAAAGACVVAVTGGDFDVRINGLAAPAWTALRLAEGDELAIGARRSGARAYVSIAGGFAGDRWLGSLSTNLMARRGGMQGRALVAGDVLSAAAEPLMASVTGRQLEPVHRPSYGDHTLHAIAGPHFKRLAGDSSRALSEQAFSVGPDSDRMGYRLSGPRLEAPGEELLSFGLVAGALQLPGGGAPILLMADYQTAGGYPVIAVVASASMPVAAQLIPGDEIRFAMTDLETALRLRAAQRAALTSLGA